MSAEFAAISQLLKRVGKEGDAASMAGSVHAKLEHLATSGGGDVGYLDGLVPSAYPLATGPAVSSGTSGWGFGSWVEVVPASTITTDIAIAALTTHAATDIPALFEFGVGAAGAEAVVARARANLPIGPVSPIHIAKPRRVAANTRIAVRVADSQATANAYSWSAILYYPLA